MRLSICVATYNGAEFLHAQISSILNEVSDTDEVLIADDGSSDGTVSVIRSFGSRVRLVATSRVGGVVRNFERVIRAATGDGIVLCDQDDVWLSGRVTLIRQELEKSELVMMNGYIVDAELNIQSATIFSRIGVRRGFLNNLLKNSFVGCCMAFRRELRDKVLPFPREVPWHDWYIGLVAECRGGVKRVEAPTLLYRRHGHNLSPTGEVSANSFLRKIGLRIRVLTAVGRVILFRGRARNGSTSTRTS